MRTETKTFTVEYVIFDVGEKITPATHRCCLPPGIYTVTECIAPINPGEDSVVFVEGHKTGVDACHFTKAKDV